MATFLLRNLSEAEIAVPPPVDVIISVLGAHTYVGNLSDLTDEPVIASLIANSFIEITVLDPTPIPDDVIAGPTIIAGPPGPPGPPGQDSSGIFQANIVHLSKGGNDTPSSGRGSFGNPYKTIDTAVIALQSAQPVDSNNFLTRKILYIIDDGDYTTDINDINFYTGLISIYSPQGAKIPRVNFFTNLSSTFSTGVTPKLEIIGRGSELGPGSLSVGLSDNSNAVVLTGTVSDEVTTHIFINSAITTGPVVSAAAGSNSTVQLTRVELGKNPSNESLKTTSGNKLLLTAKTSTLTGSLDLATISLAVDSTFQRNITVTGTANFSDCKFQSSRVFTGPANSLKLDGASNFEFLTGGWALGGAATKNIFEFDLEGQTTSAFYVSKAGSDVADVGRGSILKPYKTLSALAAVLTAPTTQAEFEKTKHIHFLDDSDYSGDVVTLDLPTGKWVIDGSGCILPGIAFNLDDAERFTSTEIPRLVVTSLTKNKIQLGDDQDSITITGTPGFLTPVNFVGNDLLLAGKISAANLQTADKALNTIQVNNCSVVDGVAGSSVVATNASTGPCVLSGRGSSFVGTTNCWSYYNLEVCVFSDNVSVDAAPSGVLISCTFSGTHVFTSLAKGLVVDSASNMSFGTSAWTLGGACTKYIWSDVSILDSATVYVHKTVGDNTAEFGRGSFLKPYQTITAALTALGAPTTLATYEKIKTIKIIDSGDYSAESVLSFPSGRFVFDVGNATIPRVLWGPKTSTMFGSSVDPSFRIFGRDGFCTDSSTTNTAFEVLGTLGEEVNFSVEVENITFSGPCRASIVLTTSTFEFDNCVFNENGSVYDAIACGGSSGCVINLLDDCQVVGALSTRQLLKAFDTSFSGDITVDVGFAGGTYKQYGVRNCSFTAGPFTLTGPASNFAFDGASYASFTQSSWVVSVITAVVIDTLGAAAVAASFSIDNLTAQVDGIVTVFTTVYPYVAGTLEIWVSGVLQSPASLTFFTETTPSTGVFTAAVAPDASDNLIVRYVKA